MKIRAKLSILSSVFLILMMATIVIVVSYTIYNNGQKEVEHYRTTELERIKLELKDHVDMAYTLVETRYNALNSSEVIEKQYGTRVKNVVEMTVSVLEDYQRRVDAGEITLEEAKASAKAEIAQIRYDDGTGYLWINDTSRPYPKMIMHPTNSALDGQILNDKKWETAIGATKNLFAAAVNVTARQDSGFVAYKWPKPTKEGGLTKMQDKISYVSLFKPWGWVLGSGIYFDDVQKDSINQIIDTLNAMRYDNDEGYFFIVTDELPYPTTVTNPIAPQLNGTKLDNFNWDKLANNHSEHLFTALVKSTRNEKGAGFIDYVWNKPGKDGITKTLEPKISYNRAFKPLNWIIGSGVYTDSINKTVTQRKAEIHQQVKKLIMLIIIVAIVVLLLSFLASWIFAGKLSKALQDLTEVAREISLGKGLDKEISSTVRKDEVGQLARAIERLQTSVKMMMKRMQK